MGNSLILRYMAGLEYWKCKLEQEIIAARECETNYPKEFDWKKIFLEGAFIAQKKVEEYTNLINSCKLQEAILQ